jgi:DNA replication protein DnaC
MNQSIHRQIASRYDQLRLDAAARRDERMTEAHRQYPELAALDRLIAQAGADLLLEAIDPAREKTAAARKKALLAERQAFLTARGLPETIGEIVYACSKCSDTGHVGSDRFT